MYELNQHKRKDSIKWTLTFIAIVLLAVMVVGLCLQLFAPDDKYKPAEWFKKFEQIEQPEQGEDNEPQAYNSARGIYLMASAPRLMANSARATTGVSKTITAVITGEATNAKIDWTIEQSDDFSSSVDEPVTVTPTADGALTATVTCYGAFDGVVYVKATIRGIGSFATVPVTFKGIPSSLSIGSSTLTKSGEYYNANATGDYTINLSLDNAFHSVGSEYGNYQITVQKYGKIKFTGWSFNSMFGQMMPVGSSSDEEKDFSALTPQNEFIQFSVVNGNIAVKVNSSYTSYSYGRYIDGSSTGLGSTTYSMRFKEVISTCYYLVTIKDTVSNLTTTVKVGFGSAMETTVALSENSIEF